MMSVAYLDHALELLLKSNFESRLSAAEGKRMFGGSQSAILGTFSAKIRTAYAFGLLFQEVYRDLLIINDIRNAFAHSLHQNIHFSNRYIAEDCDKLICVRMLRYSAADQTAFDEFSASQKFTETVRQIYANFKGIVTRRRALRSAYERVREEADRQYAASGERAPSLGKSLRPYRHNPARRKSR
jgi:DNA-binding MltR family transcriptional regulator